MSKTKAELEAELAALYDIFAAIGQSGANSEWIVGYTGGIKNGETLGALRIYAAAIRAKDAPAGPKATEDMTILVLGDEDNDPVTALLATGHTLDWDPGTVQNAYVLSLHRPDGTVAEVGYGQTQDAALANLRGHLAEPQECRS